MSAYIFTEILQVAASVLALAVVFDLVTSRFPLRPHTYRFVIVGLAVGMLGIAAMAAPLRLQSGLVFDSRSVVLAVSGLFFGAGTTLVAMAVTASYRLSIGGMGALTGVMVILSSGLIGIAWRYARRGELRRISAVELYALGLIVHTVMLTLMLTLPGGMSGPVLTTLTVPLLIVFPVATAALGALLASRLNRETVATRLEESEARYRALFENNHAVMLVVDPDTDRIIDANPAAVRFYGWPRSELCQRTMSDLNVLSTDEQRSDVERAREGRRSSRRCRHRIASGDARDVEVLSGSVTIDARPVLYSIVHDVTAEAEAIEALRLRSAALEAAANAIMITDRSGTIEWVNQAFTTLYGYTAEEVTGRNPRDLLKSGVQGEEFYQALWTVLESGETWSGRITNRRKDGTLLEEDLTITPVPDAKGEVAHYIAVKQDLTGIRSLEQRLALAQKLESVGQLAGGVAHDFNNLLTVINGTLDVILSEMPADHEIRPDLQEVRYAGDRAATLTRQLLAFGRRQQLRREAVDLNALVLDMSKLLGRMIGEDVLIVTDLADDLVPVLADVSQLEQVIMNLAVNARDAMPDGGTLTIKTENAEGPAVETGDATTTHAILTVRDTGHGIDPAIQPRIFDPFFSTKEAGKGTGLGLATVYGIVTQTGGEISVESVPGHGSSFRIRLPRSDTDAVPRTTFPVHEAPRGSETVLIVEDENAIRILTTRILSRAGYRVLAAAGGQQALEMLESHRDEIALLVTDVVMPGMSGLELAARARAQHPGLKVLFASGYSGETLASRGVSGELQPFLQKPFTVMRLMSMVRNVLDG